MNYQHDDASDSEPFLDSPGLPQHEPKTTSSTKKCRTISPKVIIYTLFAHLLPGVLVTLLVLAFLPKDDDDDLGSGDEINRIVPSIKTRLVEFDFSTDDWVPGPNDPNVTDTIFENWTKMLPNGQGMVKVPNFQDYPYLAEPSNLVNEELAYNTAWVHQLHCVYWVMSEYHRVLHHGPNGKEYFIDPTHNSYHTSHCFNYIRQAILCGLDTTLEGEGRGVGVADGSGQTHVCRDKSQSIEWLEANKFIDWRAIS